MKKKLTALLLCLVMALSLIPSAVFGATISISADGIVTWETFGESGIYEVSVRQLPDGSGLVVNSPEISTTSFDLKTYLNEHKIETGTYYVLVRTAAQHGYTTTNIVSYNFVSALPRLDQVQNRRWQGTKAVWDSVTNAVEYSVTLKHANGSNICTETTSSTSWDFSGKVEDGCWFEVVATADHYRNSPVAESPKYGTVYTVTVTGGKACKDTWGTNEITSAKSGDTVYLIPAAPEGMVFTGWAVDAPSYLTLSGSDPASFIMPGGNVHITANFAVAATHSIAVRDGRASTDNTGADTISSAKTGDKVYLIPGTAPAGKKFAGWTVNTPADLTISDTLPACFIMPDSDVLVEATFRDIVVPTYQITVTGGKASTDSSGENVITGAKAGQMVYLTPTVPDGQEFMGWTVNAPSSLALSVREPIAFTMPSEDVTITANFRDAGTTYNITVIGGQACTDNSGENVITKAKPGDKVYLFPAQILAGSKDLSWTVNAPSDLQISTLLPASFIMPEADVSVTMTRSWYLDTNGCLHIMGAVTNSSTYSNDATPWLKNKDKITSVVTENGASIDNGLHLFGDCKNLTTVDLSYLDTSNVTNMGRMFEDCTALENLDVSSFDTDRVNDMFSMFDGCSSLTTLTLGDINTANVTDMSFMFANCSSLTAIDVSRFDTTCVEDIDGMFSGCSALTEIGINESIIAETADQLITISHSWKNKGTNAIYTTEAALQAITGEVTLVRVALGDVNGDGDVNNADLTALLRHVAKIQLLSSTARADVTGDSRIDAADITYLAQILDAMK